MNSSLQFPQDPFAFFLEQAALVAPAHGLPVGFVPEALAILRGAYGDTWLLEELGDQRIAGPFRTYGHTIARWLATPDVSSVASLMELALYLKSL